MADERPWRTLRLAERALTACLRLWPREARGRDGQALVAAFRDAALESGWRPRRLLAEALAECTSIAGTGLAMRTERVARAWGGATMGLFTDIRYASRSLLKDPAFTLTATATLAVGIGANAAVFGIVDQALFQQPSLERPDELVLIWNTLGESTDRMRVSAPDVAVFQERTTSFAAFAFMNRIADGAVEAPEGDGAEHVRIASVTAGFFDLLGIGAAIGRTFSSEDANPDRLTGAGATVPPVVVITDGLWRRTFGGDAAALGSTVLLDGRPAVIVGVLAPDTRVDLPPGAGIATDADVWVPFRAPLGAIRRADGRRVDQDSDNTGAVLARLRTGVSLSVAQTEMSRLAADLRVEFPDYAEAKLGISVRSLHADATAHARELLIALLAGVVLVLIVACLNVSTLLLARGLRRRGEVAIRMALGAGRGRVARQLVTESLLLVGAGLVFSLFLADVVTTVLARTVPASLAPSVEADLGPRGFLFAVGLALALAAVLGGVLAIQMSAFARSGGIARRFMRGASPSGRMRNALVVSQVALSVVLLFGASLLIRSVGELRQIDPGFDTSHTMTFGVSLRVPGRYRGPADRARVMREITNRLTDLPGVAAVGLTDHLPLSGRRWTQPYGLPGQPASQWSRNRADFRTVSSGYFDAIGARLLEGRSFTADEDLSEDRRVVVVDEILARRIAPEGSAVGERIGFPLDGSDIEAEVVGVVAHMRHETLSADGQEGLYVPYRQEASRDVSFVVRTAGAADDLAPLIRRAVREIDTQLPVYGLQTLDAYVEAYVAPTRFGVAVLAGFAFPALLAVGLGLYRVISLEVGRRTKDIGLRIAVGADPRAVVSSILIMGLKLGAWGLLIGAGVTALAWGGLRGLVYGATILDTRSWLGVITTITLITTLACWVPARRASRLDPPVALRAE